MAGDPSYRAFFEHAIEGIFRTTPTDIIGRQSALAGSTAIRRRPL